MENEQLKEVPLEEVVSINDYLVNQRTQTAIKVPDEILHIIREKLRSNPEATDESLFMANIISVAIQLKSYDENFRFKKFLYHSLSNPVFNEYLSNREVYDLVDFLADVPSGYSFNDGTRVWAHLEIGSLITF
ncbi:hypothetical protein [Paenibacillus polymyxa]|uniref:hypothetical protein n=1 Tax=Paenibacillus polymyxa TaxID=1406 RepID=UPI0039BD7AFB